MVESVRLPAMRTRPLFVAEVLVDPLQIVGGPVGAARRIGTLPGGRFEGRRLRGAILPGGADWQTERGDGAIVLDARIVLRTDDDALIAMSYSGLRYGPAAVMERLARGAAVAPSEYYFRILPAFATSDPRYEWLNRALAIGIGHRTPAGPIYDVHEII
ncbi:DUF3237 domain-containing protein [Sphingomonas quercus]|uniref:UPF0311 protein KOF26_13215 n=1 Tax=Sphingomonas quercus TaxID=2842451 RepID=A0ABS6BKL0_9SPHN|nr:DUF3237 domain-containing protein [Sphingomonas quercus]MBU3078828.1 DUF3237 domain-containing protein [Sphingomonas quercus]